MQGKWRRWLWLAAAWACAGACAQEGGGEAIDPAHEAWRQALAARAEQLAASGDARDQAVAALLAATSGTQSRQVDARLSAAWARAPHDPLVARLVLRVCGAGCDTAAVAETLVADDPGNAANHLQAWQLAQARGDQAAARRHFDAAAAAGRYDPGYLDIGRLLRARLDGVPGWTPLQRDRTATLLMEVGLPPLVELDRGCRQSPALRGDCRAILALMAADGSSLLVPLLATAVQQRLGGDAAAARRLRWLQQQAVPLLGRIEQDPPALAAYLDSYLDAGEVPAMQALLRTHGIADEPPGDWHPPERG